MRKRENHGDSEWREGYKERERGIVRGREDDSGIDGELEGKRERNVRTERERERNSGREIRDKGRGIGSEGRRDREEMWERERDKERRQ